MQSFIPQGAFARRLGYELLWLAGAWRYATINVGFSPVDAAISGHPEFAHEMRQIQLYRELCRFTDDDAAAWRNFRVLEAGCGTGQGLAYVRDACAPESLVGLDYSAAAVRRSRARGLDIRRGSADALPFDDASFDRILCVDSLNSFPREAFLREARRVLVPQGRLLIGDYRDGCENSTADFLGGLANNAGLALVKFQNATAGVVRALDEDHARKEALISWLPQALRRALGETLSLRDSRRYRAWQDGRMTYYLAILERA